jgi:hypothetical protein
MLKTILFAAVLVLSLAIVGNNPALSRGGGGSGGGGGAAGGSFSFATDDHGYHQPYSYSYPRHHKHYHARYHNHHEAHRRFHAGVHSYAGIPWYIPSHDWCRCQDVGLMIKFIGCWHEASAEKEKDLVLCFDAPVTEADMLVIRSLVQSRFESALMDPNLKMLPDEQNP